jgi:hypothetical protein
MKGNAEEYRDLNLRVQRACQEDRAKYMDQTYQEIQESAERGETKSFYKKISQLSQNFKPQRCEVRNKDGTVAWGKASVLETWKDYCKELYREEDDRAPKISILHETETEPKIIIKEVRAAIKSLKNGKALGRGRDDKGPRERGRNSPMANMQPRNLVR